MPRARRKSNRSALRPWSSARSEPSTRPPLRLDDQRERGHAATADAAEKVISELGHRRNLQALPMAHNSGDSMGEEKLQDRRGRAGVAHVAGRCRRACRRWPSACIRTGRPRSSSTRSASPSHGHFAGDDDTRARAFLDIANDDSYDAVWFARGGYGSCRVAEAVVAGLTEASRRKTYLGYSDAGALLAGALPGRIRARRARSGGAGRPARRRRRCGGACAGLDDRPRAGGAGADGRRRDQDGGIQHHGAQPVARHAAAARPRRACADAGGGGRGACTGSIARCFTSPATPTIRRVAGIMLGRCSAITPNEPDFGMNEEEIARHWCARSGFRGSGAPTSGTTSTTRSCRSAAAASPPEIPRTLVAGRAPMPYSPRS